MSRAFADAIREAGFAEVVSLVSSSGLSVTVSRSNREPRALLHVERPSCGRMRVRFVLAEDEPAGATALLAAPAPEHCYCSVEELAVAIVRRDRMTARAERAGASP